MLLRLAEFLERTVRVRIGGATLRRIFGRRLGAFRRFVGLVGRDIHDGGAELGRKTDEVRHRLRLLSAVRLRGKERRGRSRRGIHMGARKQSEWRYKSRDAKKREGSKQ